MRVLVLGAGSTGGYFGARLAKAGRDTTFLVRPQRMAKLELTGLEVVSPHGDFSVMPKMVTSGQIDGPYDVVLVTVKAYALEGALSDIAPAVGPGTMILPVLNGMKQVDEITEKFGPRALIGGVCKIAATLDRDGRIIQMAPFHELVYGEMDGSLSERVKALDAVMQGAGFDARLSATVSREMWEKWIMLATLGSINCLMRGNVGEIQAAPGGPAFVEALLAEVVKVVSTVGEAPSEAWLTATRGLVMAANSPMTSSMYRDLAANAPVEADQIVGDLIARANKVSIPVPLLSAAYANLSIYQARLVTA